MAQDKKQFYMDKDFPLDSREIKTIMLHLKSLMEKGRCKFTKEAKAIYDTAKYKGIYLKDVFIKLIPPKKKEAGE